MAIPSKGSRIISVNNSNYRWLIRRKATYLQTDYGIGKIHVAIELNKKPNNTLIICTDRPHPQDIGTNKVIPVKPSDISSWIKTAIEIGWEPNKPGPQTHLRIQDGKMLKSVNKHKIMKEYAAIVKHEDSISICLYIEQDRIMAIGDKMSEINEEAYMNGYNWEAFFNYYLSKHQPELLENLESDPEAGMYAAYYEVTSDNEKKAQKFLQIIVDLIENENKIYDIVRNEGEDIEWD